MNIVEKYGKDGGILYLFEQSHNGYYSSYIPFVSNKELSQQDADKFIREHVGCPERIGSDFLDLKNGAAKHGYKLTQAAPEYGTYAEANLTIDKKVPKEFVELARIKNISGNY